MTMSEGDLAVAEIAFVQRSPIAPKPPPRAMTGAYGWVRANLLSTPFNIALTLVVGILGFYVVYETADFLLIHAVWSGADREACLITAQRPEVGA